MFNLFNKDTKQIGTTEETKTVVPLKDMSSNRNQGVILFNHTDLQSIKKNSGPLTKNNEYQVHYWALIFRFKAQDKSILDIAIPTVFFNYKQQVTSGHVDFELDDVDEVSETVEPIHEMKMKEIIDSSFKADIESYFNLEFQMISTGLHTMHKHPGGMSQSFSGTDYSKTGKLGVVFPLGEASNDRASFSGIMVNNPGDNSNNAIAHFEYRTANGKFNENLVYTQGRCAALISRAETTPSYVSSMFGEKPKIRNYASYNKCSNNDHFENIQAAFDQINFNAFTDAVIAENVEAKVHSTGFNNLNGAKHRLYNNWDWDEDLYGKPSTNNKPKQDSFADFDKNEYGEALDFIERHSTMNWLDENVLVQLSQKAMLDYYQTLCELAYGEPDLEVNKYLKDLDKLAAQEELWFNLNTVIEEINEYKDDCEEVIRLHEKQMKEEAISKPKQKKLFDYDEEISLYMRQELIAAGFNQITIATKTNDEISELYNSMVDKQKGKV